MNRAFSKILILIVLAAIAGVGFFAWQQLGAPRGGTIDETANWKTYRDEEIGFEFNYPDDWKLDVDFGKKKSSLGGGASFVFSKETNEKNGASIGIIVNRVDALHLDWRKQADAWSLPPTTILIKPTTINFNGQEAITGRIINTDQINDSLFTSSPNGKWTFSLSLYRFNHPNSEDYFYGVYKKVLDSFKFI